MIRYAYSLIFLIWAALGWRKWPYKLYQILLLQWILVIAGVRVCRWVKPMVVSLSVYKDPSVYLSKIRSIPSRINHVLLFIGVDLDVDYGGAAFLNRWVICVISAAFSDGLILFDSIDIKLIIGCWWVVWVSPEYNHARGVCLRPNGYSDAWNLDLARGRRCFLPPTLIVSDLVARFRCPDLHDWCWYLLDFSDVLLELHSDLSLWLQLGGRWNILWLQDFWRLYSDLIHLDKLPIIRVLLRRAFACNYFALLWQLRSLSLSIKATLEVCQAQLACIQIILGSDRRENR